VINSYDIDGVIYMGDGFKGLRPGPNDIIITGRSAIEEQKYTTEWLHKHALYNLLFMNPVAFNDKTRENSGAHKAATLNRLLDAGVPIGIHFEDDDVQASIIEANCPRVKVVRICHDLVEKENVWNGPTSDSGSTEPTT
jgi:hypothetical protein